MIITGEGNNSGRINGFENILRKLKLKTVSKKCNWMLNILVTSTVSSSSLGAVSQGKPKKKILKIQK